MIRAFVWTVTATLGLAFVATPSLSQTSPTPKPSPSATPAPAKPPSAADRKRGAALVDSAVKALGGAALIDGMKGIEVKSKGVRKTPGGTDMEATTTTQIAFPDRYRQEMVLPFGTIATVVNEKGAFMTVQGGALPLPDEQKKIVSRAMSRNLVALLRARKSAEFAPAAAGTGTVEGTRVDWVTVTVTGEPTTLGIDAGGRILQASSTEVGPTGAKGTVTVTFSDYRKVEGLSYPFASVATFDGQKLSSSTVESVKVNPPFEPATFEPPAGEIDLPSEASLPPAKPSMPKAASLPPTRR